MALLTKTEILEQINDEWEDLVEAKYPEDRLTEMADSAVPIYYLPILEAWRALSFDESNRFSEVMSEIPISTTIWDLMRVDLFLYYDSMFRTVYNEQVDRLELQQELAEADN